MDYRKKLLDKGIPASIGGFELLNEAITIYQPDMPITKKDGLYNTLAKKYKITPSIVERRMRHAITHTDDIIPVSHFIAKYKILWNK